MKHLILNPNNVITHTTKETIQDVATDILACIRLLCPIGYDPNLFTKRIISYLETGKDFEIEEL